jgi:hypothetical protein
MAWLARIIAYIIVLYFSGQDYIATRFQRWKVFIAFDHIADGLVAKNQKKNEIHGFAISDSIRLLSWAQAIVRNRFSICME